MDFIDEATISVAAGNGGAGCVHFRREKYVPRGGPDGGDGGRGGSVILIADPRKHTLLDFQYKRSWQASHGAPGDGGGRNGRAGNDLVIPVPVGTQVYTEHSGTPLHDLTEPDQQAIIAVGGNGGRGNVHFKSSTNQTPRTAQPGQAGEAGMFRLSLKLLADVGLIGLPNAGKSTLISRISAARPKIADYPFTTLTPTLGVVRHEQGQSFVVADIPGLVPGAHAGKGLGLSFLKHIERTRLLLHLVDPLPTEQGGLDPVAAFELIQNELQLYSTMLTNKPRLVVITKIDALTDQSSVDQLTTKFEDLGYATYTISSVSGAGLPELLAGIVSYLKDDFT